MLNPNMAMTISISIFFTKKAENFDLLPSFDNRAERAKSEFDVPNNKESGLRQQIIVFFQQSLKPSFLCLTRAASSRSTLIL